MKLWNYRIIDLTIFAFILCILEVICLISQIRLDTYFFISISITIVLIVLVRWNAYGLIHASLVGIAFAILTAYIKGSEEGFFSNLVVYGIGNLFVGLELLLFKFIGKEKMTKGGFLILYAVSGIFLACLGRAFMSMFFGNNFFTMLLQFITTESLNFIVALIILFITSRQDSILRDQKKYFYEVRGIGGKDEK